jgi:hypothetical protein
MRTSLLLVGAALLVATAGCTSAPGNGNPPATTPAATAAATETAPAAAVDLQLTASPVLTDGSVGTRKGTAQVNVHNNGTTAPGLTLTFSDIPQGVQLDGDFWKLCTVNDNGTTSTATCPEDSVPAGGDAHYAVGFANIVLGQVQTVGRVTVSPTSGADDNPDDNSADLSICTNGCSLDMTAPPS